MPVKLDKIKIKDDLLIEILKYFFSLISLLVYIILACFVFFL